MDKDSHDELITRTVYAGVLWASNRLKVGHPIPSLFFAVREDGDVLTMPVDLASNLFPVELLRVQQALRENNITRYIFITKVSYAVRETDPENAPTTKEEAMALLGHSGPGLPPDAVEAVQVIYGDKTTSIGLLFNVIRDDDGEFQRLDTPEDEAVRIGPSGPLGELLREGPQEPESDPHNKTLH